MHIIIDGYNLFKIAVHRLSKEQFVAQLSRYARLKNHIVTVIFDGGDSPWPFKELFRTVTIVHAGVGRSADDYIKEIIAQAKCDLFVSSDNDLADSIMEFGVPVIDSRSFSFFIQEACGAVQPKKNGVCNIIIKKKSDQESDVDELMKWGASMNEKKYKDSSDAFSEDIHKHGLSRNERALMRITKKL